MAILCSVCGLTCGGDKNDVKCSACEKFFHIKCVSLDLEGSVKTRSWKCRECRGGSSGGSLKSSSDSTALTKEFIVKIIDDFKSMVSGNLETFRKELEGLSTSMQFMSGTVDETNKLMKEIKEDYAKMKKENEDLKKTTSELNRTVSDLQEKVRSLEQYTRKNNIEVSGIPTTPGESVQDIVKDVGKVLGVEVDGSQINAAHRIPSFRKDRSSAIIVQFHARATKEEWVTKFQDYRRKNTELCASKVNSNFRKNKVFVSEHLSPDNKVFLSKLKQKCRDINFKFAWHRDGKFYARKSEGERCIRVTCMEDILKLK